MPNLSLTVREEYIGSTALARAKKLESQIDYPTRGLNDFEKFKSEKVFTGSEKLLIPFKFGRHSEPTRLSTGFEEIDHTFSPIITNGQEEWCDILIPAGIAGHETRINSGPGKAIDLFAERQVDAKLHLRERHEDQIFQGSQIGFDDHNTLNGDDNSDGLLESVAVGSQNNTVHNISRTSYLSAHLFQNQFGDIATDFSANGLDKMYDVEIATRKVREKDGMRRGYASTSFLGNLKKVAGSREQYVNTEKMDMGHLVLVYNSIPLEVMDLTATGPVSCYIVDHDKIKIHALPGWWYKKSKVFDLRAAGFEVMVCYVHVQCQLIGTQFASSAVLQDGDTY